MSPLIHVHVEGRRVLAAGAVTIAAAAIELAGSSLAGSLFLTADAVHLLAHLVIFLVLLLPQSGRHAIREDVATCAVLAVVLLIAAAIGVDSIRGLVELRSAPRPKALLLSLFGLAANLMSAWLFRDPARERWSFRAALAHELSDASLTVAGLLGAGAIAWWRLRWVDPGLSLLVAIWLSSWAGRLLVLRARGGPSVWYASDGSAPTISSR